MNPNVLPQFESIEEHFITHCTSVISNSFVRIPLNQSTFRFGLTNIKKAEQNRKRNRTGEAGRQGGSTSC